MAAQEDSSGELRVAFDGVSLVLGRRAIFRGLCCGFARGRINVVLGGSGAGKSTLLRCIGGLQRPDEGSVRVAGRDVARLRERELYEVREHIGMLFQGGALLDSMTIAQNVALPLRERGDDDDARVAREVRGRLESVGLPDVEEMFPRQLSGGMRRRAALARAIVANPDILLCDEPFSGLDPVNVRRIESLLVALNQRLSLTMIVTSHHLPSTLRMADHIVFLREGCAVQGPPEMLLASDDAAVVEFLTAEDGSAAAAAGGPGRAAGERP